MVRSTIVALVSGLMFCSGVSAKEGSAPDSSLYQQRVSALIDRARQLQRDLEQLDHSLDFPAAERLAVFLSRDERAPEFKPSHLILTFADGTEIQHYLDDAQQLRFASGAPLRILSHPFHRGAQKLAVTISGQDGNGQLVAETLEQTLSQQAGPLYLEYSLVAGDRENVWQTRVW